MRRIILEGSGLEVSRFAFGTASLHHIGATAAQVAHLVAAAEAGFCHFDTAPLYGFGAAEEALGQAFANTSNVTLATKVGLYPPGSARQSRLSMLARKAGGKLLPALSRPIADLAVARARRSLDDSLRRLQRDRVDLLLLHEPLIALLDTDEWSRWAEDDAERIGMIGIAGPSQIVAPFVEAGNPLAAFVQTRDDLVSHEADFLTRANRNMQITYGYLSASTGGLTAEQTLRQALRRNRSGAILVSTRSRARLPLYARLSKEVDREMLAC